MQGAKLVNRTSVLAWRIKKSLKPDVRIAIRNTEEKNSISQLADVDRFFGYRCAPTRLRRGVVPAFRLSDLRGQINRGVRKLDADDLLWFTFC